MLSLCKHLNRSTEIQFTFWGTSSVSEPQLWRDSLLFKGFSTTFFNHPSYEVIGPTGVIPKSHRVYNRCYTTAVKRCFHCAILESKYWNSVYTLGHFFNFSIHSCEVYFSSEDSLLFNGCTTFIQYIKHSGQHSIVHTWIEVLKFSIVWGTSSGVPQLWRDSLLFRDFSTTFIQCIKHTEVTSGQQVLSRCFHCARLESTEIQYTLLGHFFNFSTTAVKR